MMVYYVQKVVSRSFPPLCFFEIASRCLPDSKIQMEVMSELNPFINSVREYFFCF